MDLQDDAAVHENDSTDELPMVDEGAGSCSYSCANGLIGSAAFYPVPNKSHKPTANGWYVHLSNHPSCNSVLMTHSVSHHAAVLLAVAGSLRLSARPSLLSRAPGSSAATSTTSAMVPATNRKPSAILTCSSA
jgi:hypothetical protein